MQFVPLPRGVLLLQLPVEFREWAKRDVLCTPALLPRRNWCWIKVVKYRGYIHSECFFELTCCWAKIHQQELHKERGWVDAYVWCSKRNERELGCVSWRDGDTSFLGADLLE